MGDDDEVNREDCNSHQHSSSSDSTSRRQKFGSSSPDKRLRRKRSRPRDSGSDSSSSSSDSSDNEDSRSESSQDSDDDFFDLRREHRDPYKDPDTDDEYHTRNLKRKYARVSAQDKRVEERTNKRQKTLTVVTGIAPKTLTKLDHHHVNEWILHMHALRNSGNFTHPFALIGEDNREFLGVRMAAYRVPNNPRKRWVTEKDLLEYRN